MAAEKTPSAQKAGASVQPSVRRGPVRPDAKPIPAEMMVPVARFPAEMRAPTPPEDWLTSPTLLALAGEQFAAGRLAALDPAVVEPSNLPPNLPSPLRGPLGQKAATSPPTLAPVPLPPRRPVLAASAPQPGAAPRAGDRLAMLGSDEDDAGSQAPDVAPAAPPIAGPRRISAGQAPAEIEALILRHADRYDIPPGLIRRVAWRESKFDPRQRNGPYWGLMQISLATARGLGFRGAPSDLLDADTNMTYAVAYLANAYKVAGRNERRADALYRRGYYYEAKRKGMLGGLIKSASAAD